MHKDIELGTLWGLASGLSLPCPCFRGAKPLEDVHIIVG
jgi:hypothetical protein